MSFCIKLSGILLNTAINLSPLLRVTFCPSSVLSYNFSIIGSDAWKINNEFIDIITSLSKLKIDMQSIFF